MLTEEKAYAKFDKSEWVVSHIFPHGVIYTSSPHSHTNNATLLLDNKILTKENISLPFLSSA